MSSEVLSRLKQVLGSEGWLVDPAGMAPYLTEWGGRFHGETPLVARPASTSEVAAVVRICHDAAVGIVPQGGKTGLVGGSIPDAHGNQILLSLERMGRIRDLDVANLTATVEAGCVLATLNTQLEEAQVRFPLSLGAEGSCQIGGNLATNAGGTSVLRHGSARELVLGLEVVLATGEVWPGLRRLRKDNTGYDLKQLFLGSEGTLGIITAAVLKLVPKCRVKEVALAAVRDLDAAIGFFADVRTRAWESINAFEYMDRAGLDLVLQHIPRCREPMTERFAHTVLVELASSDTHLDLKRRLESCLEEAYERGEVLDAVVAASEAQAAQFWRLRETIPEAQRHRGNVIKHDISVPVSRVPDLLRRAAVVVNRILDGVPIVAFGHLGDGNIHFNLGQPAGMSEEAFLAQADAMTRAVHDLAMELEGSFSAEHGIGCLRRSELKRYKSPVELELMRALKAALDPHNILNPGKVL